MYSAVSLEKFAFALESCVYYSLCHLTHHTIRLASFTRVLFPHPQHTIKVTNAKTPEGQTNSPAMISAVTRNSEVLIESIPCTVLQAILLSRQGGLAANPLQTTSMLIGLVATSYAVADSHVDLDQSLSLIHI